MQTYLDFTVFSFDFQSEYDDLLAGKISNIRKELDEKREKRRRQAIQSGVPNGGPCDPLKTQDTLVKSSDHNVTIEKPLNSNENVKDQPEDKCTDRNPNADQIASKTPDLIQHHQVPQDFIPLESSAPETLTPKVNAQVEDKPNGPEELPPYQPPFQKDRKNELEEKKLRLQRMRQEKV